jgi:hypothetical protein
MIYFAKTYSKSILVGAALVSVLALASCETPGGISKTNRDYYHHNRGSEVAVINPLPIRENPPVHAEASEEYVAPAPQHHAHYEHVTHFDGCSGSFSLADENSGRVLIAGQGISTQQGIIVLDGRGNRTSQVVNNVMGQSLIFQPNCDCRSASEHQHSSNQSNGATCTHG